MSIDHGKLLALADKWKALADTPHDVADDYNAGQIWAYAVAQAQLREALAQPAEAVEGPPPGYRYPLDDGEGHVIEVVDLNGYVKVGPDDAAQGAVAWEGLGYSKIGGDDFVVYQHRQTGAQVYCRKDSHAEVDAALKGYTHPQAAPAQGDGWRLCYSAVIHALAAIVNVRCPDKLFDLDAIPRGPVMEQVILIREAMDRFGKARTAAPSPEPR